MSYPGGWDGQQVDPFTGDPIPHNYPPQTGYQQPQYQQSQTGWQQDYGGFGMYQPPEPPKKSRGPLILALVVGLVVVLSAGGVVTVLALRADNGSAAASGPVSSAPAPTPSSSEQPPSESPTPGTTTRELPSELEIRIDAVTRGWQGVWSPKDNVAYDVPDKDWQIETPGTLAGFENPNGDTAIMRGVSTYKDNYCGEQVAGWHRARVGTQNAGDLEPSKAARAATHVWGTAVGELPPDSKKVSPTAAKKVSIADGALTAQVSSAVVPLPKQQGEKCADATKVRVTVAAFQPEQGADTTILILYTDVGVDDELATTVTNKIIASLRPYDG